ncbi:retrovirus-related pol polyprotein from transposon TNT 1-94 [Tanacetum coccineum]
MEQSLRTKLWMIFCREKGIKREYSVARTPQQNGVAERRNRTLIEAARTMLADSKLPTTFWAEAVSTTCYFMQNVDSGEPKTADDAQRQDEDGLNNENAEQERFSDDRSSKDVNAVGKQVNTTSPDLNTGCLKLNAAGPYIVNCSDKKNIEPTSIAKALSDSSWVEAMQEELPQFKLQQVWILVDLPNGKKAIRTKWVFRIKKDKRGIVIRNKERLVAQGHKQEEGIDYEEVFAPVARIETIRKKSMLLNHQDLKILTIQTKFRRGKIDQTLFIKKQKGDILLVQVYVDDIIFGSTNKELCTGFDKLIKDKFQMSSMGELTFFLGS